MFMKVTIFSEGGDVEEDFQVPSKFEVCPGCDGHGTDRGRSVECDGGGFTASEWAEACDDDPGDCGEDGFAQKYFSGAYDRTCECCDGKRVIQVIDRDLADPVVMKAWDEQENDRIDFEMMSAAERRMGA